MECSQFQQLKDLNTDQVYFFYINQGFEGVSMRGSEHNDIFHKVDGKIR